uniref:Uncharacterized protein n=1 Tax=Heterorhabditis bacteriophora TaxID=37862 RepID=A0A1I7WNQ1_HETBA
MRSSGTAIPSTNHSKKSTILLLIPPNYVVKNTLI